MTSLDTGSSSHTVADKISVICSDGAEIDVDLRISQRDAAKTLGVVFDN